MNTPDSIAFILGLIYLGYFLDDYSRWIDSKWLNFSQVLTGLLLVAYHIFFGFYFLLTFFIYCALIQKHFEEWELIYFKRDWWELLIHAFFIKIFIFFIITSPVQGTFALIMSIIDWRKTVNHCSKFQFFIDSLKDLFQIIWNSFGIPSPIFR